jgi:enoyl-CoA hydratase
MAPAAEHLLVDVEGAVATITLNRPEHLNAISEGLRADLLSTLRQLNPGDDVRVIRLRGAGRAFCAGYDLSPGSASYLPPTGRGPSSDPATDADRAMADLGESRIGRDREALRAMVEDWLWVWGYRKPIIAQVHGFCLSGGLDLIGCCDIVWAAAGTRLGHPAGRGMGIPVTLGMLPVKIGAAATKQLLFTGDLVEAAEAKELGIVDHVVDADELDERTMALCRRIALNPLDALTVHKHVTNRWLEVMGLRLAALEGADFDAIFHETPALGRFAEIADAHGLRAALDWRDGPYRQG